MKKFAWIWLAVSLAWLQTTPQASDTASQIHANFFIV